MIPLVEKYQPETVGGFVGLDKPRAIFGQLAANPYPSAWLLLGPSGLGKTTMALALAKQIGELHHIPSAKCDKASVDEICHQCWYVPMGGGFHVILVDEADQMSHAAQLAFLSKLDATAQPPNTIFLFTANDTSNLKDRFLSRCRAIKFSPDGMLEPAAGLLSRIWVAETAAPAPDFHAIVKDANYNIRQAIMSLEVELLTAKPAAEVPVNNDRIGAPEVAARLQVKLETVYRYIMKGKLPLPSGRPMYWQRSEISPYLEGVRA